MSEWVEEPLGRLVTFQKGRKVDTVQEHRPGYARDLGASGLVGLPDGYGRVSGAITASDADVLMLWDGERSGLVGCGQTGVVASTVSKLSPRGPVHGQFLYYALARQFDWIQNRRTGSGVPHVPKEIGRILQVRYPRQKEQQHRIAAVLASLDDALAATEALIEKHQQIKAGLMHDLFTRGVMATGQLRQPRQAMPDRYRDTLAGHVPVEWSVVPARAVCSLITKGTTPLPNEMWQGGEGVRFLRVDNLTFDGHLTFAASDFRVSARTHATTLARSRCLIGDVLMNIVGPPLGKIGHVIDESVNINQAIALFRPQPQILSAFLLLWLVSDPAKQWILQRSKQTSGQVNATLAMCQAIPVPLPGLDEQARIVAGVAKTDCVVRAHAARLNKLRAQKLGLMHDLLTGKVRVPLPITEGAA